MNAGLVMGVYPPLETSGLAGRPRAAFPFSEPGLRLTHLGRGAVWLALRAMGLGPGSRLAVPAYHCGSEVEAARLAGVEVDFYGVDAALQVDEEDLAKAATRTDAVYLTSFFGFPTPAPPSGTRVIEDMSHALFSSQRGGPGDPGGVPLGSRGEAAVFSPRKSLGVPDGGAVLCRSGLILNGDEPSVRRPPWKRTLRSLASVSTGRLALARPTALRRPAAALLRRASQTEASVRAGTLTETVIGEWNLEVGDLEVAAARSSALTAHVVRRVDADAIRARRRENYKVLADALADTCPERFRELPPGTCPLYFPVQVPDRGRAIADLQALGVRALEVWPVPHPLVDRERFRELEPARRELLALPVHQALTPWHVEALVAAAKAMLGRHRQGGAGRRAG